MIPISSMNWKMKEDIVWCLERHMSYGKSEGARHLKRFEHALSALKSNQSHITFTQYESIAICYKHYFGTLKMSELEKFIGLAKSLEVLNQIGD